MIELASKRFMLSDSGGRESRNGYQFAVKSSRYFNGFKDRRAFLDNTRGWPGADRGLAKPLEVSVNLKISLNTFYSR